MEQLMTQETRDDAERRDAAGRRDSDQGKSDRRNAADRRAGLDRRRGPGRRRAEMRKDAEEGEMSGELLEFVMVVDEYKRINDRPFPTWSEIFEIVHFLGYRRVAERAEHINHPLDPPAK